MRKSMQRCLMVYVITLSLLPCFTGMAQAVYCTFSSIDFPGASTTDAFGINNADQIAGAYQDAGGKMVGLVLDGDSFSTFEFPGASGTWAFGINDVGHVVGPYTDGSGVFHGYFFDGSAFTAIDFPDSTRTEAKGINNAGKVVGYFRDSGNGLHGFLRDGGSYTTIDFPLALATRAFGINDSDDIVGEYKDGAGWRGFLLDGDGFTTIDFPGATKTRVIGINNGGKVVGRYWDANEWHGFLLDNGSYTTIDYPDAAGTRVVGINDAGKITGRYWDEGENRHGFVVTQSGCANTTYHQNVSFIKFNLTRASGGKALLYLRTDQDFCDALKGGVDEVVLELEDCDPVIIPGSTIKPNRNKTRFRAKSPAYFLKIDCTKGLLKIRLKNVTFGDCVSNPVTACVYSTNGPYLCAEGEFEERRDKQGRLKKLIFSGN